jgi:hypothetical protein
MHPVFASSHYPIVDLLFSPLSGMFSCLLLSVVGGLSSREIARLLDLGEAAVRQRLARARKMFQRLYLQESGEAIVDEPPLTLQRGTRDQQVALVTHPTCAAARPA